MKYNENVMQFVNLMCVCVDWRGYICGTVCSMWLCKFSAQFSHEVHIGAVGPGWPTFQNAEIFFAFLKLNKYILSDAFENFESEKTTAPWVESWMPFTSELLKKTDAGWLHCTG